MSMSSPNPLPPVPAGMRAEVLHDGVAWTLGMGLTDSDTLILGVVLLSGLVAFFGGMWPIAILLSLLAVAVFLRAPRRTEVRLSDRHVVVEIVRMLSRERKVLRLDELDVVKLTDPPEQGGSGQIVLRAEHEMAAFGRGSPREHARWFVQAIEAARTALARRERREGREYSFLRVAPEEVDALRSE